MAQSVAYQAGWYYDPAYQYPAFVFMIDTRWYVRWVWYDPTATSDVRLPNNLCARDERLGFGTYQRLIPLHTQRMEAEPPAEPSYWASYGQGIDPLLWPFLFIGVANRWSEVLLSEWGYAHSAGELSKSLGLGLGFVVGCFLVDYSLWSIKLKHAVRAGLWAGASLGSFAGLVAYTRIGQAAWSYLLGISSTIIVFSLVHMLDQRLLRKAK